MPFALASAPSGLLASQQQSSQQQQQRRGSGNSGSHSALGRARRLAVRASGLESKGLFTTNSSLLGPKAPGQGGPSLGPSTSSSGGAKGPTLDEVALESGVGVDYAPLRDMLKAGQWREAEDETRAKLIEAAGAGVGCAWFGDIKWGVAAVRHEGVSEPLACRPPLQAPKPRSVAGCTSARCGSAAPPCRPRRHCRLPPAAARPQRRHQPPPAGFPIPCAGFTCPPPFCCLHWRRRR